MKKRTAPLTFEDLEIRMLVDARFLHSIAPRPLPEWASFCWILSDRRDAELMYCIERCRLWERLNPEDFADYKGWAWVHSMIHALIDGRGEGVRFADSEVIYFP